MAYSSTNAPRMILAAGIGGVSMFIYSSTHTSTEITATGFFTSAGRGGRSASLGMSVNDILLNHQSNNGRVTMHAVTASTANQASTAGSTGWAANYNATVSAAAT